MMQFGRIEGRKATLYELLQHMINLYKAAHNGNACWHEAEYYGMQARWKSLSYSVSGRVITTAGIT